MRTAREALVAVDDLLMRARDKARGPIRISTWTDALRLVRSELADEVAEEHNAGNVVATELPWEDVTGKFILSEVFGSIELDGQHIDITRSLTGLHFYLEIDGGRREVLDVGHVFKKWSTEFLARARA